MSYGFNVLVKLEDCTHENQNLYGNLDFWIFVFDDDDDDEADFFFVIKFLHTNTVYSSYISVYVYKEKKEDGLVVVIVK